jgi:hypothetical protein
VIDAGGADAAAAYEQLRRDVLQGSPHGGHVGLILLMREGVAAWIDCGVTGVTPEAASTTVDRVVTIPAVSPTLHAGIVDVLVHIVLTAVERELPDERIDLA